MSPLEEPSVIKNIHLNGLISLANTALHEAWLLLPGQQLQADRLTDCHSDSNHKVSQFQFLQTAVGPSVPPGHASLNFGEATFSRTSNHMSANIQSHVSEHPITCQRTSNHMS
ncbi:hypothetical protein AMECASPLE_039222 [Ameca splendens]|uniref:Uncharacterized protein n=1 Tax=Ameca splendens TaxID=208324 RepID=A0ABV0XLH4_9TELE